MEQWRQYAIWEGQGAPPDLLLSIINNESGGRAGIAAGVGTKFKMQIPLRAGGTTLVDRAYGLMQAIPAVIVDFNKAHPSSPLFFEDISGPTAASGRLQIRAGAWLFNRMVRRLNHFYPDDFPAKTAAQAEPEQLTAALTAYAIGMGALMKKFGILKKEGKPLTHDQLHERFPLWGYSKSKGQWINRPLHYSAKVWDRYMRNRTNDPGTGNPPPNPGGQPETIIATGPKKKVIDMGFAVPIVLLLGAWFANSYFKGKK